MTKQEVQQRVLQNGKPLPLDKFEWDENANTFSSKEDGLVLDFKNIGACTFNTGGDCTFKTGSYCTFKTGKKCVVVRRDIYEVIELTEGKKIRLNGYLVKGYKVLVKKPKKVVLTMDEVAKLAGVDVNNLKIRK